MATRRILVVFVALLVLLAGMTAFVVINEQVAVREGRMAVNDSREAMQAAQALYVDLADLESAERAYLLSAQPSSKATYDDKRAAIGQGAGRLRKFATDARSPHSRAEPLIAAVDGRIALADRRVAAADRSRDATIGEDAAERSAQDGARLALAAFTHSEQRLLEARRARSLHAQTTSIVVAIVVGGLAVLGLAASMAWLAVVNRRLAHEVGERQAAETAQWDSEARYRAVFANTADYLYAIDVGADGVFRMAEVNPAYEQATGATTARLRGVDIRHMAEEAEASARVAHLQRVVDEGRPVSLRDTVTLNGERRIWESVLVPVRNEDGHVERIIGSSRDVTERENAEEQLRRAQRMEAVGHLTGGVAHDFNNLLQVIRGNLELVAADLGDQEPAAQRLKNALQGANRAAQLTRQLLAFARRQPLEPKVVNLGRLVTDMAEMLRGILGESIQIDSIIAGGLWHTLADPAQVESAILNLAINARDAMPNGGRLTIEISNAELDQAYVAQETELQAGEYVMLAVSDTGVGMPPETVARVFEPFFTTKGEEKGTGLGLSMVYGFVKQSQGHAQIYSEVGHGTTVRIYLPRSTEQETLVEAPAVPPVVRGRSETILVVEDDDLVRASAVNMLRDLGYICIHAPDGAAALETIRSGAKVDLLFTDVIMPGPVRSRDLALEAQKLRPTLPVLFTSGYTEDAIVHHGRLDEGIQLLSKPYTQENLARKIGGLLQEQRPVVLVVEDDPLVRLSAVDMIENLGFTVVSTGDAERALVVLATDDRIDVLFTDVGLPGMRGPELAQRAIALRPGLKVIFASGYADTAETLGVADAVQLGKPYEQDQLAEVLVAAMA